MWNKSRFLSALTVVSRKIFQINSVPSACSNILNILNSEALCSSKKAQQNKWRNEGHVVKTYSCNVSMSSNHQPDDRLPHHNNLFNKMHHRLGARRGQPAILFSLPSSTRSSLKPSFVIMGPNTSITSAVRAGRLPGLKANQSCFKTLWKYYIKCQILLWLPPPPLALRAQLKPAVWDF